MEFPRLFRVIATGLALCLSGISARAQTTTTTTVTRSFNFPAVGLASSETAQINVVNLANATPSGTAASCSGTITFYNSSGTAIGTATPFTVTSGEISSATLPFSALGASGNRQAIRGVVMLTVTRGSGVPCILQSSLETYDTVTGVTHLVLPGTQQTAPVPINQPL
jgi:hypothetical protein